MHKRTVALVAHHRGCTVVLVVGCTVAPVKGRIVAALERCTVVRVKGRTVVTVEETVAPVEGSKIDK
jgi:hypothetical protein